MIWPYKLIEFVNMDSDGKLRVRYKGWAPKWDETVKITSARIAPPGSRNAKEGPRQPKQGEDLTLEAKVRCAPRAWRRACVRGCRRAWVHVAGSVWGNVCRSSRTSCPRWPR